jgi:hypothetical protein
MASDPEVQVRLPELPDFMRSSGSGTVSNKYNGVQLRSYMKKKVAVQV